MAYLRIMELLRDVTSQTTVAERWHVCPDNVDLTTVQSYLIGRLGDPLRVATSDGSDELIGWVFAAPETMEGDRDQHEVVAVPVLCQPDIPWTPAFQSQREERARFEALAKQYGTDLQVEHVPQKPWAG